VDAIEALDKLKADPEIGDRLTQAAVALMRAMLG
jgi:hypothetical protein